MLLLRRVATGIVAAAALAVLTLSLYLLWNARADYLPLNTAFASDHDEHERMMRDKLDIYTRRINQIEMMVIILLGIAGLYTIVFILTADVNARSVRRQVERAMNGVNQKILASIMELTELREIKGETRDDVGNAGIRHDLELIYERVHAIVDSRPSDERVLEVLHYERALPALELLHARNEAPQLARIYRELARHFRQRDAPRSRFYMKRAATLAPEDFETANGLASLFLEARPATDYSQARKYFEASLAAHPNQQRAKYGLARIARSEGDVNTALSLLESAVEDENWETKPDPRNAAAIHYELACVLALLGRDAPQGSQAQYMVRAVQHLKAAFAYPSRQLEQMFSRDTEDGGDLSALANTPPYDNAVNDLMLTLSVGAA